MRIHTQEQANELNLGDATVTGILWGNTGRDLTIRMSLGDGSSATLDCSWFNNLKIDLDFKDLSQSLTWDVVFTKNNKGMWHIAFDFGGTPEGLLEFDCNDVDFQKT
jgi:hypothetical protein